MTTQVFLIRHGEYRFADEQNRLIDLGLTDRGIEQAMRLRDRLAATREIRADVLLTSSMLRARETAEIIAPVIGLNPETDADFEEWRNTDGIITPEVFIEQLKATPVDQRVFLRPVPTGETWAEFMFRAGLALNRITRDYEGKTIVVVGHGGIIEASFVLFFGLSLFQVTPVAIDPEHTSITCWRRLQSMTQEKWQLERFNDVMHLYDPEQS